MYTKLSLIVLSFLLALKGATQITLAKEFSCVTSSAHYREDFFSNGTIRFHFDTHGREVEDPAYLKAHIEDSYAGKLLFKRTKDGLYWASGLVGSTYRYVILIPESLAVVSITSPNAGSQFSNYSTWLLQQVRINRSAGKDYFLTDYKGRTCRS